MPRCAKCQRKSRTLSYAGGYCGKCERKAVRAANQEFSRAATHEQNLLEQRRRELTELNWPGRIARGIVWGSYDGLRSAVILFAIFSRIASPHRGYDRVRAEPRWPGWRWFAAWFALTLAAVLTAYVTWGDFAAVIAFLATAPVLGAIRGGLHAARNDWTWWLG